MRRRDFIATLGGAAVYAWPRKIFAQQSKLQLIGFLRIGSSDTLKAAFFVDGFLKGLADAGYVVGKEVLIEYRWATGYGDLPALANELVERHVDVLVVSTSSAGFAAKAATKSIPIVFAGGGDPVELGLVDSLSHPNGNITGIAEMGHQAVPKHFELLHDLVPGASAFAMLINPNARVTARTSAAATDAVQTLGGRLNILSNRTHDDLSDAFARMADLRVDAFAVVPDSLFFNERHHLLSLAARYQLPGIYFDRSFVTAGGLMSYGSSMIGVWYQVGQYTARILRGEKPSDLPIQQPTRFELVINLKTAKALRLDMPATLLVRADEVIE